MEVFGYYREKENDQNLKDYKFNYVVHTIMYRPSKVYMYIK